MAEHDLSLVLVVTDAGPIIHLDELGCLDLLFDCGQVLAPLSVWDEASRHRSSSLMPTETRLTIVGVTHPLRPEVDAAARLFALHKGEIESLHLALENSAELYLTDDTAARLAARSFALPVHGTLGVLLRSIRRQLRTTEEVRSLLHELPDRCTLHVKRSLLNEVILQVEQLR